MAKKSAVSKGFRKQTVKKPYLSKKEIIALCALVAVLIVGAVLLFSYDDGALKVQDGKPVVDGENWLLVNGSATRGRVRYFKLGEVGEIEGCERESAGSLSDANIPQYSFKPQDEAASYTNIEIGTSHAKAEAWADYVVGLFGSAEGYEVSEVAETTLNGVACRWSSVTHAYYEAEETEEPEAEAEEAPAEAAETEAETEAPAEVTEAEAEEAPAEVTEAEAEEAPAETEAEAEEPAEAEAEAEEAEPEPNHFTKTLNVYFDALHDSCIVVSVTAEAPSAEAYPEDEALLAIAEQAVAAVTLEAK